MELRGRRYRHRIDFSPADHALLVEAADLFGLNRSEVMRRLLRGAMQVGPAMSAENDQQFAAATKMLRALGLEIKRMQIVLKSGVAVDFDETEAVWAAIVEQVVMLTNAMTTIVVSYGIRLREAARLEIPPSEAIRAGGQDTA